MTVDDVSQYLCIGKNTVYELLHSNQLKGFRIGKSWRISKDALNLYIKRSSGLL
ncbi:helix-turn-helix domain-containing protein [Blautia wexlerae]|uniref:helix-turn-helix domain-containing protein n=2 Tax=Blautia TaxID=572511 RepID=UPI0034A3540E